MRTRDAMIYRRVSLICALLTTALGTLTLIGWVTGIEALASMRRNYIPMAPSTALAFAILGTVMVFRDRGFVRRPVPEILLGVVAAVAAGKLFEFSAVRAWAWRNGSSPIRRCSAR